jgi:hypothetical protein
LEASLVIQALNPPLTYTIPNFGSRVEKESNNQTKRKSQTPAHLTKRIRKRRLLQSKIENTEKMP